MVQGEVVEKGTLRQEPTYALQQTELSVDDFVGEREERGRDGEAERLGGLEVDHQLERDRLHDGKIGSLGAFENPARIDAGLLIGDGPVRSVTDQSTGGGELAV